jgi:AraC-like DNA-binding protein
VTDDHVTTLRLLSATFTGPDRIEEFRETYGRAVMRLDIEPLPGHSLDLDFVVRGFAGISIASGRLSPTRNTHTAAMISDDDLVLVCATKGHGTLRQIGREVTIGNGEATLISNGSTGVFLGHEPSYLCNLRLNRAKLSLLVDDIDAALVRPIPRHDQTLRLMMHYTAILNDDEALATPELRRLIATHMHDLAALLLGPTRDGGAEARNRGLRAARLTAIYREFERCVAEPDFSLPVLASRLAITPRYVQRLLAEAGTSFGDELTRRRLRRAREMLASLNCLHLNMTDIALECGFSSVSHFHRMFRRHFEETPGDVRAEALRRERDFR